MTLKLRSTSSWLVGLAAIGAVGCDSPELEHDEDALLSFRAERDTAESPRNPNGPTWISNGLEDPSVSGIDPDHPLSSPAGLHPNSPMLSDPANHQLIEYLVECALPPGHSIITDVGGETLEFEGLVGLAPEWEDDACDQDCQEWVSACLLARTNVSGDDVVLWLKADHPAIGMETHPLFPVYEASFFGNLFADPNDSYICQGSPVGATVAFLEGRTCSSDLNESCGFTKYTDCEWVPRCTFQGLLPTAIGCSPDDGLPRHTISTSISAPVPLL